MSYHGLYNMQENAGSSGSEWIFFSFFIFISLIEMLRLMACSADDSRLKMLAKQLNIKLEVIRLEGTCKIICSMSCLKKCPSYGARENLEIKSNNSRNWVAQIK